MKKRALIVLAEGFEDIEAVAVIDVLNRVGVEVTIASLREGPVKAAYGTTIVAHTTIEQLEGVYDALIFPGGKANAASLASHPLVIKLIHQHLDQQKIVAAICAAPSLVLGEAGGILRDKHASGDPGMNNRLAASGAILTNKSVTVDGNIITSVGPGSALEFGLTLGMHLAGEDAAMPFAKKWGITLAN